MSLKREGRPPPSVATTVAKTWTIPCRATAQRDQDRLRDRLATADPRLSVLIDADSASGCDMPKTSGTGAVDHAAVRARLNPAHAQRNIAITDTGDHGLFALQA